MCVLNRSMVTCLRNNLPWSADWEICTLFQLPAGNMGRLKMFLCGVFVYNMLIFKKNIVWHDMCYLKVKY
jgi:hypothetical protein